MVIFAAVGWLWVDDDVRLAGVAVFRDGGLGLGVALVVEAKKLVERNIRKTSVSIWAHDGVKRFAGGDVT